MPCATRLAPLVGASASSAAMVVVVMGVQYVCMQIQWPVTDLELLQCLQLRRTSSTGPQVTSECLHQCSLQTVLCCARCGAVAGLVRFPMSMSHLADSSWAHHVAGLPKTRSGKIMRRVLRKIAAFEESELGDTSTLAVSHHCPQSHLLEVRDGGRQPQQPPVGVVQYLVGMGAGSLSGHLWRLFEAWSLVTPPC